MTKTTALVILTGTIAAAANHTIAHPYTVTVCREGISSVHAVYAQAAAQKVFRDIGVKLVWQGKKNCPTGALRMTFTTKAPATLAPTALAYALPFEGTRIVVFIDRIAKATEPLLTGKLLAHVMVHEITHILQGTARHSAHGVMKARWTTDEYQEMGRKPLPFADEDVRLIQLGLDRKAANEELVAAAR